MKIKEKKWIRFRIYLVAFFFLGGFCAVLARGYQLQVLEKDKLVKIAQAGYRGKIRLPPKRGIIYDREGHELAVSVEVGSIYAHPSLVKKKKYAAKRLSEVFKIKQNKIERLLNSKRSFVWIKRKVSPEKIREIEVLDLEGLGSVKESRRYYPGREIAGHLLGFTGQDHQGLEGIEKTYDKYLKGPEHTLLQMRDAFGRPFYLSRLTSGDEMHDIVLTIDKDIQYRAEQSLKSAVEKTKAKSGQCIIVDTGTGQILAMAVAPHFNPNIFQKYRPQQWRNRTITDVYEPGSTIKAFLLSVALEKSILSPQTMFYCERGEFKVANHVIHDTGKYGNLSVSEIITHSSNIGAVKIGFKIGYKRFSDYLKRFGFGSKTGIDLIGERKGFIRSIKKARRIDKANIYFGQGMTASSIQLVMAMAAIANGGKLMRPYVVKEIRDQQGRTVKKNNPTMVRRVLSERTARRVSKILEGVVSEHGTAPLAAIDGYRVAGKTGTSQKVDPRTRKYSRSKYVAIFVGFVPAENPKLAMVVVLDEPKANWYGGLVAGPVFSEVGSWTLNYLRVNPQLKLVKAGSFNERQVVVDMYDNQESVVKVEDSNLLPDFRGHNMREVLRKGRSLGLKVILKGSGLAVRQTPSPGTNLSDISTLKVNFQPPV